MDLGVSTNLWFMYWVSRPSVLNQRIDSISEEHSSWLELKREITHTALTLIRESGTVHHQGYRSN